MFLESYKPRTKKVISKKKITPILLFVFFFTIAIILILIIFGSPKKKVNSSYQIVGKRNETKNIIKIDNAKLAGIDNKNRFFTVTATSALKKMDNENIFLLTDVKADISNKKGRWALLNTNKANYDIVNKLLISKTEVEFFYDDGSTMVMPSMIYNLKSGILKSEDGVILFGKWGTFKAGNFLFDTNTETFKFYNNPIMVIN